MRYHLAIHGTVHIWCLVVSMSGVDHTTNTDHVISVIYIFSTTHLNAVTGFDMPADLLDSHLLSSAPQVCLS